jgi:hypothetical protein
VGGGAVGGLPWRRLVQRSIAVLTAPERVARSSSGMLRRRLFRWRRGAGSARPERRMAAVGARAGE